MMLYLPENQPAAFVRATLSACGRYRYQLGRQWRAMPDGRPDTAVLWIMLNPSIADADVDDPTIRACRVFSERWGFGAMEVGNLFALRATNPRQLALVDDPVGPENDLYLEAMIDRADQVVCAWGVQGALLGRGQEVRRLLYAKSRVGRCLGLTKAGHPRHPLYVRRDTRLEWMPGAQ